MEYFKREAGHKRDDFANAILNASNQAALNPYTYRIIPEEQHPEKREILVWDYRLMYRIDKSKDTIYITGLYHQRQFFRPSQVNRF